MPGPSRKRAASIPSGPWSERQKKKRVPETCEWVVHEAAYRSWKNWDDSAPPGLWIHGPAGIGKTFLAQFILDDLGETDDKSAILSCFCDAASTPSSVLRTILAQLIGSPQVESDLKGFITKTVTELSPGAPAQSTPSDISFKLWDAVVGIIERGPPLTIVVDGLDELPAKYLQPQEFDFTSRLVDLTSVVSGYVRVLVLSRTNPYISLSMNASAQVEITALKVQDDLNKFTNFELAKHPNLDPLNDEIRELLVGQSEGIFLWISLSIQALAREPSTEDARKRLEHLPGSLDGIYAGIIERQAAELTGEQIMLRDKILRWIMFAVRPLRAIDIANAVSVESLAFIPDLEAKALEVCGSLVKTENGLLKPIHHSLRDFLLSGLPASDSRAGMETPVANLCIAKTLLTYLSHPKLIGVAEASDSFQETHPLAEYATLYWVHHASQSIPDAEFQEQIQSFFRTQQAQGWFDRLLPGFLPRSVLPVPPRPPLNARFFHLLMLKSQLVNCFEPGRREEVDTQISASLRAAYERFLEETREKYGQRSPEALRRQLELGELYSWLPGYQKQVRGILEEVVQLFSQTSSTETGDLRIAAYQALADEVKRNGDYKEAQNLLDELLDMAANTIPANDPRLVFILDSLGWVSMRLGQLDPAASYLQRALDIAAEQFGSQSPFTLRSGVTLAEVLGKLGRHSEAGVLCEALKRQLKQHEQHGTPLPRDSISQLNTLAAIYMQEAKYDDAKVTYQFVVDDRRKIFGSEHRLTLWAEMQLGLAMKQSGDLVGARELLQKLLPRQISVLGSDHRDVMDVTAVVDELST